MNSLLTPTRGKKLHVDLPSVALLVTCTAIVGEGKRILHLLLSREGPGVHQKTRW